ncbi:hypothetical protein ACVIHD_003463 [Bradyrhizobium embrapense]
MQMMGDLLRPEKAARRIMEHARAFEPIQDGRIYIEKINHPIIDEDKATPAETGQAYSMRSDRAGSSTKRAGRS